MSAESGRVELYGGPEGYVTLLRLSHGGRQGASFRYVNPNPAKMHAVDTQGMLEMEEAVSVLESQQDIEFCVFSGAFDPIHAGADITEFRGDCDIDAIARHLSRGTSLDTRIKALWPRMRTVGVLCGDRYGGSVEWPLFAEWAVCEKDARIQLSEVHLGIIPGWNGVLNVLLKASPERALWMGQTGNTLKAAEMKEIGIVQEVVETPDPPSRRDIKPEEWTSAWQEYTSAAEPLLMGAAFELASAVDAPQRSNEFPASAAGISARAQLLDDLRKEVGERTDASRYRKLYDTVAKEAARLRREEDESGLKDLVRSAPRDVAKLGKPLAPLAVKAVANFVAECSGRSRSEILENYEELGQMEAELCASLMHTRHRRIGVDAVLSRKPEDKVPVFD